MGEFVQHPDHQRNDTPDNNWAQHPHDQGNATPNNTPKTGIDMETIPSTAVCKFVGEGAANVVFELSNLQDHPTLKGQLLRLPKDESNGPSYADLQKYWVDKVSPLFAESELVQQKLVQLPQNPAFIDSLNQLLEDRENADPPDKRRHDFRGHRFKPADMKTGMLVADMRPRKAGSSRPSSSGTGKAKAKAKSKGKGKAKAEEETEGGSDADDEDSFTLKEVKPKWLHQSPRAPDDAEQCRNCAREVNRNLKNGTRKPVFCPLNLVKVADFPRNQNVKGDIREYLGLTLAESENLQTWLHESQLLRKLRSKQWELDHSPTQPAPPAASSTGAVSDATSATSVPHSSGAEEDAEEADEVAKYCLAMTLRDCSLFLKIPRWPGASKDDIVAKLADLDKKNYETKHEYWARGEDDLHKQNLYSKSGADGLSGKLTDCQLPYYKANLRHLDDRVRTYYRPPPKNPQPAGQSNQSN